MTYRVNLLIALALLAPLAAGKMNDQAYHEHLAERVEQRRAVLAASPQDAEAQQSLASALYYLGVAEDQAKPLKEAEQLFARLHDADPDDALVRAYLGSLALKKAKRVWAPWKKGELSKRGIMLLDAAVEAAPEDPHVRFVRAATTYHLPKEFERRDQTRADFAWLAARAEQQVGRGALPAELAAAALVRYATLVDDAAGRKLARRAVQLAPESHAAWEAQRLLDA
jgi:hypothetical protein